MASPSHCPHCGERYEGGKVLVRFLHCWEDCRDVGGGHLTWWCRRCGWRYAPGHEPELWYEELGQTRTTS